MHYKVGGTNREKVKVGANETSNLENRCVESGWSSIRCPAWIVLVGDCFFLTSSFILTSSNNSHGIQERGWLSSSNGLKLAQLIHPGIHAAIDTFQGMT